MFQKNEKSVLNKGFNYNLKTTTSQCSFELLGIEAELALLSKLNTNTDKHIAANVLQHSSNKTKANPELTTGKSMKTKSW